MRTLSGLLAKGPGFDTSSLISFGIKPALNGYSPSEASQLIRRIHEDIRSSASTQTSAIARVQLLIGGAWNNSVDDSERRPIRHRSRCPAECRHSRILRDPRNQDCRRTRLQRTRCRGHVLSEGGQRVAIVNEAFVKRYFGGRNPLGARIVMGSGPDAKPDTEIIGVVENISYRSVREQWEQAYFPMRRRVLWLEFLCEGSGNSRVSLSIDSDNRSQRRSDIADHLFPHAGRAGRPILEYGAYAGGAFQQLRHAGAPALAGWPVRCDVFRGDPTHARDRYSTGAGGDTPFYRSGWCSAMRW